MIQTLLMSKSTRHYYAIRKTETDDCSECAFIKECVGDGDGTPAEGFGDSAVGCGCKSGEIWHDEGVNIPSDVSNILNVYTF